MERRTGKTTRIVDRCIQELFKKGKTYLYDESRGKVATHDIFDLLMQRLGREHETTKVEFKFETVNGIYCAIIKLKKDK